MKARHQIVDIYRNKVPVTYLVRWVSIARSSIYYKPKFGKKGRKPSVTTTKTDGTTISNIEVINMLIRDVYGQQEFNRYGYILSTEELREMGLIINPKKVYRLMDESGLLLERLKRGHSDRHWVKWRKIKDPSPLDYICMDIKYVYIQGEKRNAFLLAIIDVCTRYVLGWSLRYTMKHPHVIMCLDGVMSNYPTKEIILRTDNGSQFIAHGLRKYLQNKPVMHEFTHVATPEENAYVESLFSNVEREVIKPYEFESYFDARDVFERYFQWYNTKRKHHGIGRMSPLKYWQTRWDCHPVRPPIAQENFSVQDFFQKNTTPQGVEIFLEKPEGQRSCNDKIFGLHLPNQVDNNVLN